MQDTDGGKEVEGQGNQSKTFAEGLKGRAATAQGAALGNESSERIG
jgi:hypothetical protein